MKQYLLSVCYPAGGSQPPPAALNKIMSDLIALLREMQSGRRVGLQRRTARLQFCNGSSPPRRRHRADRRAIHRK